METFLSDPEVNAINPSVQPRQEKNEANKKATSVRSKDMKQIFVAIKQQSEPNNTNFIE